MAQEERSGEKKKYSIVRKVQEKQKQNVHQYEQRKTWAIVSSSASNFSPHYLWQGKIFTFPHRYTKRKQMSANRQPI